MGQQLCLWRSNTSASPRRTQSLCDDLATIRFKLVAVELRMSTYWRELGTGTTLLDVEGLDIGIPSILVSTIFRRLAEMIDGVRPGGKIFGPFGSNDPGFIDEPSSWFDAPSLPGTGRSKTGLVNVL